MGSPTSPHGGHVVGPSGQLCGTPGGRTTILILTVPRRGSCRLGRRTPDFTETSQETVSCPWLQMRIRDPSPGSRIASGETLHIL